jgi:hypothetical protein
MKNGRAVWLISRESLEDYLYSSRGGRDLLSDRSSGKISDVRLSRTSAESGTSGSIAPGAAPSASATRKKRSAYTTRSAANSSAENSTSSSAAEDVPPDFMKEYLKTREGKSDSTYRADKLALTKLEVYAAKIPGGIPDLRRIDERLVAGWVAHMRKEKTPRYTTIRGASINSISRVPLRDGDREEMGPDRQGPGVLLGDGRPARPRSWTSETGIRSVEVPYLRRWSSSSPGPGSAARSYSAQIERTSSESSSRDRERGKRRGWFR